jgi:lysine-N-methylase
VVRIEKDSWTLVADEQQQYACQDCPAKCCRFPWKITINQAEFERYREIPWVQARFQQENVDFIPKEGGYELPRVLKSDGGGGCIFLDADNLCGLQKQMGHEVLPVTCQTYPFSFVSQGPSLQEATIYSNTSFFCNAILYNYGEPITGLLDEKYRQNRTTGVPFLPDSLTLGGIPLAKPVYLILSDYLQSLFERTDLPVTSALMQANQLLHGLVASHLAQSQIDEPALRQAIATTTETPAEPNCETNGFTGRVLIAILLSYVALDSLFKAEGKAYGSKAGESVAQKVKYAQLLLQIIQEKGQVEFWNLPKPVGLSAAKAVRINEADPLFQVEMRRFYSHLFQSKIFFAQKKDLLGILFSLATNYASILRLARYAAYAHDRQQAKIEDFKEAIGCSAFFMQHQGQSQTALKKGERLIMDLLAARAGTFERVLFCESY